jgi:NaMN:DMB phosphoribosyltransferase
MDSKKEKHDKKEKSKDKKHDHREVKPSLSLSSLERIPKTGLTHKLTPEQCPIEFVTVYGDRMFNIFSHSLL